MSDLAERPDRYRTLFLGSSVLALAVTVASWWMLPAGRIPVHFGAGGEPDAWGERSDLVPALSGVTLLLALFLGWIASRMPTMSLQFVNMPRKEFWTRPENEARARARAQQDLHLVGAWTMWLMTLVPLLVVRSVRAAEETGSSGVLDIVVVVVACLLLTAGAVWRQRWFRRNADA